MFLSWALGRTSSSLDSHQVHLCRQLGEKLGLKDREQVGALGVASVFPYIPGQHEIKSNKRLNNKQQ